MHGPNPANPHPMEGFPQVCFIKNVVKSPNIIVGDYTYYDDPEDSENFERNVLYHYPFIGDKLVIGKFCAIAANVRISPPNHPIDRPSLHRFTYCPEYYVAGVARDHRSALANCGRRCRDGGNGACGPEREGRGSSR